MGIEPVDNGCFEIEWRHYIDCYVDSVGVGYPRFVARNNVEK